MDRVSKNSFGSVQLGAQGSSKTFTVKNTGTSQLSGLVVAIAGTDTSDFVVSALGKTSFSVGAETTFKVTFKPTATGTRNAVIQISSNDAYENPFDFTVTGMAVAP